MPCAWLGPEGCRSQASAALSSLSPSSPRGQSCALSRVAQLQEAEAERPAPVMVEAGGGLTSVLLSTALGSSPR